MNAKDLKESIAEYNRLASKMVEAFIASPRYNFPKQKDDQPTSLTSKQRAVTHYLKQQPPKTQSNRPIDEPKS